MISTSRLGWHADLDGSGRNPLMRREEGEGALQIQVTVEPDDVKAFRETARLQIANIYYHALETFVRLFLAHAPGVECPWMQLARDEGPPFVQKLKQLDRMSNEWEGAGSPEDEHVRVAFFPVRDPKPEIKTAFGNAKNWLRFAAQEVWPSTGQPCVQAWDIRASR